MKRIIYSLYINIPEYELDDFDSKGTNQKNKDQFNKNYQRLLDCKQLYADNNGVDFKLYTFDDNFEEFKNNLQEQYPFITYYNIINFYKIKLLYDLSEQYDEILYLDYDVVPLTNENFFDVWNLDKGICLFDNSDKVISIDEVTSKSQSIRSPTSKYYNTKAMLLDKNLDSKINVINTGIIGVNRNHLQQLKYFDDFDNDMKTMTRLKSDYSFFPKKIVDFFGYDNETLMGVKVNEHKVPVQWLNNQWHYFFDKNLFIPENTKFVHAINKQFDIVWRYYD